MSPLNRSIHCIAGLLSLVLTGSVQAATLQPAAEGWSRWSVPLQPGIQAPCCWKLDRRGGDPDRGCALDDTDSGVTISDDAGTANADERLWVYVRQQDGKPMSVRSFGSSCPVRSTVPVLTLADPAPADSVAFLRAVLREGRRAGEEGLAAIAFHGDPTATTALVEASRDAQGKDRREQALFWLGQARGESGLTRVLEVAERDPSKRLRKHALFVLSQSDLPQARRALRERTQDDPDAEVRSQGLFWLAQVDDVEAKSLGLALLADPTQSSSHDETVFALSQLPDGKGEDTLIALVEGDYPRKVKKQALFWLGQSGSDKALRFLDRLLADAGG